MGYKGRRVLSCACLLGLALPAPAFSGGIAISDAFARASIPPVTTGVVYLRITNSGAADKLRSAFTPAAERAQLHGHRVHDGVMSMVDVGCLAIPAGGTVTFAPGGLHVMLLGVKSPLVEGAEITLTLRFDAAGDVEVRVPVRGIAAGSDAVSEPTPEADICD
jgi:copper(I)-binding protein